MKNNELNKLALLGIASGFLALGQPGLEAFQDLNSVDMQHMLAKPGCASHGCASLTADREVAPAKDAALEEAEIKEDERVDAKDKQVVKPVDAKIVPAAKTSLT